jgi:glycosyltransferase involved in cell wall biosynthesis
MEARIGWHRAIQAAKHWDTWIMFSNGEDLELLSERIETAGVADSLHLVCVPPSRFERWLARWPQLFYASYDSWQRRSFALVGQLNAKRPFDLVHQVSFCGYRQPGYLWKLGVPLVFGPVGGTQNFPWRFLPAVDFWGGIREVMRNVVNSWQLRFSHAVRRACRKASLVLAANSTGQRDLSRHQRIRVVQQLETGVARCPTKARGERQVGDPLRILWTGRLETWKALPLLLRALSELPKSYHFELRVLGIGKCRRRWERMAERLGIAASVRWMDWGTYSELLPHYNTWADVFAFTSLRDTSGSGLLEALAAGVPIVGVNHQGAADIMTDDCAIPIPVTCPRETIAAFREALVSLADDPARLERLSAGARARAMHFLWERHGDFMDRAYREVLAGEARMPACVDARAESVVFETDSLLLPALFVESGATI